jgi:hypothetical protein
MRAVELTLKQTMLDYYYRLRRRSYQEKYNYTTKFPWICIRCLKLNFVSFDTNMLNDNYHVGTCDLNVDTLSTQYKYNSYMKEAQIKLLKRYFKNIEIL